LQRKVARKEGRCQNVFLRKGTTKKNKRIGVIKKEKGTLLQGID